ncbi:hypothetical protein TUN199_10442 [Pyrenophora tritici-repentis]|nr:hypothetical protein PtrV1_06491 [Pyrenophora tritici-repentis]KAI0605301.1 hypothetical protein TUN205_10455 [Pyrenophora tritici-repentis]KAI0617569.1 hypothetical protein TUN199_10442 [Pyrenophora tritici-repentis]
MIPALLVVFAIYFPAQLCLTSFLLFIDRRAYHNSTGGFCGRDYCWERIPAIVFVVLQTSLSIAGLAGIVVAFRSSHDMCDWIQAGVICSLQLGAGTKLARLLQVCQHPRWTVWLTYIMALTTIPDDIPVSL